MHGPGDVCLLRFGSSAVATCLPFLASLTRLGLARAKTRYDAMKPDSDGPSCLARNIINTLLCLKSFTFAQLQATNQYCYFFVALNDSYIDRQIIILSIELSCLFFLLLSLSSTHTPDPNRGVI